MYDDRGETRRRMLLAASCADPGPRIRRQRLSIVLGGRLTTEGDVGHAVLGGLRSLAGAGDT